MAAVVAVVVPIALIFVAVSVASATAQSSSTDSLDKPIEAGGSGGPPEALELQS